LDASHHDDFIEDRERKYVVVFIHVDDRPDDAIVLVLTEVAITMSGGSPGKKKKIKRHEPQQEVGGKHTEPGTDKINDSIPQQRITLGFTVPLRHNQLLSSGKWV